MLIFLIRNYVQEENKKQLFSEKLLYFRDWAELRLQPKFYEARPEIVIFSWRNLKKKNVRKGRYYEFLKFIENITILINQMYSCYFPVPKMVPHCPI